MGDFRHVHKLYEPFQYPNYEFYSINFIASESILVEKKFNTFPYQKAAVVPLITNVCVTNWEIYSVLFLLREPFVKLSHDVKFPYLSCLQSWNV